MTGHFRRQDLPLHHSLRVPESLRPTFPSQFQQIPAARKLLEMQVMIAFFLREGDYVLIRNTVFSAKLQIKVNVGEQFM